MTDLFSLAKNLYRSQARFVFELIQNAEDNQYQRAKSDGIEPYIKFNIRPDMIFIDSNEDGFTRENVKAICRIGGSTKTRAGSQQYIGEKGIGFKSVFMVASRVRIQSGPFSFFFEHEPGDPGMGMITPEWETSEDSLPGPITRITLTLLKTLDYPDLLSQFDALPDTLLLFLTKLGTIMVEKSGFPNEASESTSYSCNFDERSRRATLRKVHCRGGEQLETALKHYYIARRLLSNLPWDEQRDYNSAEVILAFPMDTESVPIIGRQEVYAYLPIRDFGFPVSIATSTASF